MRHNIHFTHGRYAPKQHILHALHFSKHGHGTAPIKKDIGSFKNPSGDGLAHRSMSKAHPHMGSKHHGRKLTPLKFKL